MAGFQTAINLVNMSQENPQNGMAGGGTPVIINNTSVDNSSSVNSRQSVTVPQPVRSGESTKADLIWPMEPKLPGLVSENNP